MEESKDIIRSFSDELRSGEGHLYEPALSLYINFNNTLSEAEKTFTTNHLTKCALCRERFERVFDDEIDFDTQCIEIRLTAGASQWNGSAGILNDPEQNFVLAIRPDKKGEELLFTSLPSEYLGEKMSVQIAEKRIRIVSTRENEPIGIPGGMAPNEQLLSVTVTVLRRTPGVAEKELKPVFMRYVRYLAAAVFVVVAGGLLYESLNRHEEPPQAVDTKKEALPDSAKAEEKIVEERPQTPEIKKTPESVRSNILAENYKPNDVLETFVHRQYRAGAAEVIAPNNADTLSSPIRFKWKEMEGIHSFIVVVVDNKNEEMWRGSTESYELTCEQKFSSGLYYWMLKTDGDILSVRRFFVR